MSVRLISRDSASVGARSSFYSQALAVETPFRMDKFVGAPESKITGRRLVYYGAPTAPERLNEDSPYA